GVTSALRPPCHQIPRPTGRDFSAPALASRAGPALRASRRVGDGITGFDGSQGPIRRRIDIVRNEADAGIAHSEIRAGGMQAVEAIVLLPLSGIDFDDSPFVIERNATSCHC